MKRLLALTGCLIFVSSIVSGQNNTNPAAGKAEIIAPGSNLVDPGYSDDSGRVSSNG